MDELKARAAPKYIELSEQQRLTNEKIDRLILLQPESNEVAFQHYLLAKCYKEGTKAHRALGLKISIGVVIVTIAAIVVEAIAHGESSTTLTLLKTIRGFML